jgi:hypothetical protein
MSKTVEEQDELVLDVATRLKGEQVRAYDAYKEREALPDSSALRSLIVKQLRAEGLLKDLKPQAPARSA